MVKTRVSRLAGKYFPCWVLLFAGVAIGFPKLFEWIGPLVAFLLGTVMFGMGLTLKVKDFQPVFKKPGIILIGIGTQFILMPSVAYVLAKLLILPPELAVGLILVGACPGGTASNVIVYLSRGDVPLSVAMTSLSTLLAPLLTPLWLWLLVGSWLPVEVGELVRSILQVIILPVFLGILVRYFLPLTVKKINPVLPLISVTAIVIIVAGVVAANAGSFTRSAWLVLIAVILHNSIGLFMGYWTASAGRKTVPGHRNRSGDAKLRFGGCIGPDTLQSGRRPSRSFVQRLAQPVGSPGICLLVPKTGKTDNHIMIKKNE